MLLYMLAGDRITWIESQVKNTHFHQKNDHLDSLQLKWDLTE